MKQAALGPLKSPGSTKNIHRVQQLPKCRAGNAQNKQRPINLWPQELLCTDAVTGEFKGSEVFRVEDTSKKKKRWESKGERKEAKKGNTAPKKFLRVSDSPQSRAGGMQGPNRMRTRVLRLSSQGKPCLDLERLALQHAVPRSSRWPLGGGPTPSTWAPASFPGHGFCSPVPGPRPLCVPQSPRHQGRREPKGSCTGSCPHGAVRYGENAMSLTSLENVSWP